MALLHGVGCSVIIANRNVYSVKEYEICGSYSYERQDYGFWCTTLCSLANDCQSAGRTCYFLRCGVKVVILKIRTRSDISEAQNAVRFRRFSIATFPKPFKSHTEL
jgi:hypothetical protein